MRSIVNSRHAACALVAVVVLFGPGVAPAADSASDGAESPDALMKKLGAAAEVQDVDVVISCIAPADRSFLSFMLGIISVEMTGFHIMQMSQSDDAEVPAEVQRELQRRREPVRQVLRPEARVLGDAEQQLAQVSAGLRPGAGQVVYQLFRCRHRDIVLGELA